MEGIALVVAAVHGKDRVFALGELIAVLGAGVELAATEARAEIVDVPYPNVRNIIGLLVLLIDGHVDRDAKLVALVAVIRIRARIVVRKVYRNITLSGSARRLRRRGRLRRRRRFRSRRRGRFLCGRGRRLRRGGDIRWVRLKINRHDADRRRRRFGLDGHFRCSRRILHGRSLSAASERR